MDRASRRRFLTLLLAALGASAAGSVLYPLFRYLSPPGNDTGRLTVSFNLADIPAGGAKFFDFRGSTGVAIMKAEGDLAVFSAVCTHLGCIVQWEKGKQDFLCPCHAGRYTADGTVVSGPPPRPLARLPFTVTNGSVTVG